ncbi:MAG: hypothetical protein WCP73_04055 [Eubacteriales bacterium]
MIKALTSKCIDNSNRQGFQFVFFCDLCGKPYESVFIQSGERQKPWFRRVGKQYDKALENEYDQAFRFANEEAKNHFNRCVYCGMVVCDEDYNTQTNMCAFCSPVELNARPSID